jgi:hypothetical protein
MTLRLTDQMYAQLGVGAYLPAPTGVRAPWRASCLIYRYYLLLP